MPNFLNHFKHALDVIQQLHQVILDLEEQNRQLQAQLHAEVGGDEWVRRTRRRLAILLDEEVEEEEEEEEEEADG